MAAWLLPLAAQVGPRGKPRTQPARGGHAKKLADVKTQPMGSTAAGPPDQPKAEPLRPEQMPAVQPRVGYENGLLTVDAINSTMGDTLNAIRARTGIIFDGLQAPSERIAFKAGPATADEVISELFYGSRYDYLVIGRDDDPKTIQRVTLTAKGPGVTTAGNAFPPPQSAANSENNDDDEAVRREQPLRQVTPGSTPQTSPSIQTPIQSQPRTEQQMYQELQQRQLRPRTGPPSPPPPN
ncbi:MAG TPA: hypothetical protein VEW69_00020 [Alphaproteobacteria bacterium]|nr:hypothetical protein [Alphaproteobacteria bacterium]